MLKFMPPAGNLGLPKHTKSEPNIATIDVGGQLFQTTKQTLNLARPDLLHLSLIETSRNWRSSGDREDRWRRGYSFGWRTSG
ncbi:BTB/POZ domain-containing protein [Pyrus ussuriensis x Pyrus communis]|uniref:BTB/POZ domain-containing protein n=1 Tax=Pyrus ussuriensis x Pyrus communis TaxID=2448454 RepID=A0A5N5EYI7_9ROSA|nr:BTB/POZ domain-containing protein [Pyrus ussuriensis x Pyrus communis]